MSELNPEIKFEILERSILDSIPGASGVAVNNSRIYIIGDNAPFLYEISQDGQNFVRHPIHSLKNFKNKQIIKSLKPDFEALELIEYNGKKEILIFGSGSRSPQRNFFKRIFPDNDFHTQTYDITLFYDHLKSFRVLENFELNIEAVAESDGKIYLFNRGKNLIFLFDYNNFLKYLEGAQEIPEIEITEIKLPEIDEISAGFSGATVLPDSKIILFTCSVEDTKNAYDGGVVLGSFIGIFYLKDFYTGKFHSYLLDLKEGISEVKIESIAVFRKISEREAEIVLVTDSDGADSELLKGLLTW